MKLYKTNKTDICSGKPVGSIIVNAKKMYVVAQDSLLEVVELQMAGKKRMTVTDFINGLKNIEEYHVK